MTSVTVTSGIVNKKLMYWNGIFNEIPNMKHLLEIIINVLTIGGLLKSLITLF